MRFVALLGGVIEVEPDDVVGHHVELQQRSCQGQNLHSTCVGVVAWRGSSSWLSVAVMIRTARSDIRCARPPSNGTSSNQISSESLLMAVNNAGFAEISVLTHSSLMPYPASSCSM